MAEHKTYQFNIVSSWFNTSAHGRILDIKIGCLQRLQCSVSRNLITQKNPCYSQSSSLGLSCWFAPAHPAWFYLIFEANTGCCENWLWHLKLMTGKIGNNTRGGCASDLFCFFPPKELFMTFNNVVFYCSRALVEWNWFILIRAPYPCTLGPICNEQKYAKETSRFK